LKWLDPDILSEFTVENNQLETPERKKKRYRYCMEGYTVDYRTVPSTVFTSLAKWTDRRMDEWMNEWMDALLCSSLLLSSLDAMRFSPDNCE